MQLEFGSTLRARANLERTAADVAHAIHLLEGLDHLVVQDIFLTKTAQMADVVLPVTRLD